jgi:regulator of replication initiation timing
MKELYNRVLDLEDREIAQDRQIAGKADKEEVDAKIQRLEADNAKLKQENAELKSRLDKIEAMLNSK